MVVIFFFFSSRRRHTRCLSEWSSDVCSSDLFNAGTLGSGIWTSLPFTWTPTQTEGIYQIQVVIKDFTSGETTSQTERFRVLPLVSGSTPVAVPTANPLVALFSAPSCA